MRIVYTVIAAYLAVISLISEKTLLILSALGGSVAMLTVMLLIRHKTRHAKFMVGIPAIILAQYAAVWAVVRLFS